MLHVKQCNARAQPLRHSKRSAEMMMSEKNMPSVCCQNVTYTNVKATEPVLQAEPDSPATEGEDN